MTAEAVTVVEIRGALLRLRRATGLPVAFGGLVESGRPQVRISELSGTATAALRSLAVSSGSGLGGKAVALARPCAVTDYSSSRHISHEYDIPVAAEGIRSVLAVPVVVRRRVRGVLYGALRSAQPLGDRALGAAVAVARDVEQTLILRDEAWELLTAGRGLLGDAGARAPGGPETGAGTGAWEQVREAHAALRALAPRITDPVLRADLLAACGLLTAPRRPADRLWRRENWTCCPGWRRARPMPRWPSGWGCARRPSRGICVQRCGSWAHTRGGGGDRGTPGGVAPVAPRDMKETFPFMRGCFEFPHA